MFLIDTNVISEIRKGSRANPAVRAWFQQHSTNAHFLSVLTLGEIRRGIEQARVRDANKAAVFEKWVSEVITIFEGRILSIGQPEAEIWGRMSLQERLPDADGLIAATALAHGLTVATRNVKDFVRIGVEVVNPWNFSE